MSRRYGRKQKWAARRRIAVLEAAHDMACTAAAAAQERSRASEHKAEFLLDRIRLWDGEIRSLLGPYTSFAINEPTFRVDHPDRIRQMPVLPPLPALSVGPANVVEDSIAYHIETMLGFMCGLEEEDLTHLRRFLTVQVKIGSLNGDGAAYFAISEHQWRHFKRNGPDDPSLQRFIHRIAGDLMRLLMAPPKKKPSGDDVVDYMALAMSQIGVNKDSLR